MKLFLSRDSDVPLRQQLAEQIVFAITTGEFGRGEQLPSVRALALRLKIHHNTVSGAYQDLVRRNWVTRHRGSRLIVGELAPRREKTSSLDALIDESILRAKEMGYSLRELGEFVSKRLMAERADHILVVEQEPGLRKIIAREVSKRLKWRVESCSLDQLADEPGLAVGAQTFAPTYALRQLKSIVHPSRPAIATRYSDAHEHLELIRSLTEPSIVTVVSCSESLLRTARGLLAPVIRRRHVFRGCLAAERGSIDVQESDLVLCDSITLSRVKSRQKFNYLLVASDSLDDLEAAVDSRSE